jgi:large subunit ribosomal protein L4e
LEHNSDIVNAVHTGLNKNSRQAYAVSLEAGHQTAAESWGTGRAVSRIPRVPGGGTHRAGQGAFGNMCRGGRMFAPTKTWRKWHRKVNLKEKRYAVCSALAASAVPALLMARGHRVENVPEVPLVLDDSCEGTTKTSEAIKILKACGAFDDIERVKASRAIRAGKGKMRNRRYVQRKGPLVVYANDSGMTRAFRNIPGVELCSVDRLGLLSLAPGGHLGRFIIWTKSAFEKLDSVFGTKAQASSSKKGWKPPAHIMTQPDLSRVINSDEIQSAVNAPKTGKTRAHAPLKRNPLKNKAAMDRLNPYAKVAAEMRQRAEAERAKAKAGKKAGARSAVGQKFYESMMVESEYHKGGDDAELFENYKFWLGEEKPEEKPE